MTCKDFDRNVTELVRGAAPPELQQAAETHAGSCGRCAARFEAERELSRFLGQMALSSTSLETPPQVQQKLGRAFREQRQAALPAPGAFHLRWRRPLAFAAVATAAVVAVALWVSTNRVMPRPEPGPRIAVQDPAPKLPAPSPVPKQLETLAAEAPRPLAQEEQPKQAERPVQVAVRKPPANAATAGNQPPKPAAEAASATREIVTDFLPLAYGDDLSRYQGVQLVRVRLPRDALAYFGLPAQGFSAAHVPADVLLGEDGAARAVRFVRYAAGGPEASEDPVFDGFLPQ